MQTYQTTLIKKITLLEDVDLLHFSLDNPKTIVFSPGQYVILTVPAVPTPIKRLYSIASSNTQNTVIELLVKKIPGGVASEYINTLIVGQKIEFVGPAGVFSLKNTPTTKVFLTTGTGIAPIRSFLLSNKEHAQKYYLYWGLPTLYELYLFDELKERVKNDPFFQATICLSKEQSLEPISEVDRGCFSLGHINEAVLGLINNSPQNSLEYYICGRREVVESLREYLYGHGIERDLVHFERY